MDPIILKNQNIIQLNLQFTNSFCDAKCKATAGYSFLVPYYAIMQTLNLELTQEETF